MYIFDLSSSKMGHFLYQKIIGNNEEMQKRNLLVEKGNAYIVKYSTLYTVCILFASVFSLASLPEDSFHNS